MRVKDAQRKVDRMEKVMNDMEKAMLFYRASVNTMSTNHVTEQAQLSESIVDVLREAYDIAAEHKRELEFRIGMAEI